MKNLIAVIMTLFLSIIVATPGHTDAAEDYFNMGNQYMSNGDYYSAIEAFKKAVDLRPYQFEHYANIGLCYMKLKDYGNAIPYFEKALSINNSDHGSWIGLGNAYDVGFNNIPQAEYSYKRAIEAAPYSALAHENYARLLYNAQRYGESKVHLVRAKDLYRDQGDYAKASELDLVVADLEQNYGY